MKTDPILTTTQRPEQTARIKVGDPVRTLHDGKIRTVARVLPDERIETETLICGITAVICYHPNELELADPKPERNVK